MSRAKVLLLLEHYVVGENCATEYSVIISKSILNQSDVVP
jgi:hypothetical protein